VNRERAETHLRLLAEAELRRATALRADGTMSQRHAPSLALAAEVLAAVGAVDAGAVDEIRYDLDLALVVRRPCPFDQASPGPGGLSRVAQWRLERFVRFLLPTRTVTGDMQASPQAPWRVVPVGQVLPIREDRVRGELYVLAYAQTAGGARFTMTGWIAQEGSSGMRGTGPGIPPRRIHRQFTATDDQGSRYQLGFSAEGGAGRADWHGVLELRPGPRREIRRLDVSTIPGEPATRIHLDLQIPAPEITVTQRAVSPAELLLDVIAARLLTSAARFPQDTCEELAAAKPGLLPHPAADLGDIIAALQAAHALSPASLGPGQLAGLCASLGVSGHGITAPPDGNLPEPWRSMLTRYHRRQPQAAPPARGWAATAAELPELDGTRVAVLGLHHGEDGTILHVQASGVTPEDDWAYYRGARPLPALWIRDSSGRWHTTHMNGHSPAGDAGEVMLYPAIVPPLDPGSAWIDVLAVGQSAEVRARLPLRWN
jgi:hypothetical protein